MALPAVGEALGEVRASKRRGEIHKTFNGATLIDDSYNANRQSAIAAIDLLRMAHAVPGARRWLLLAESASRAGKFSASTISDGMRRYPMRKEHFAG